MDDVLISGFSNFCNMQNSSQTSLFKPKHLQSS